VSVTALQAASSGPLAGHLWHLLVGLAPVGVAVVVVVVERMRTARPDREQYLARPAARALLSADSFGVSPTRLAPPVPVARPARRRANPSLSLALAALALVSAGAVHLVVMPEHFGESWLYGAFFLVTAAGQLAAAALVWFRPTRLRLAAVAAVSLGVVLLWAWTRVIGVPLGPGAGETESIGYLDVVASAVELVAALCCSVTIWAGRVIPPSGLKSVTPDGRLCV
jgi:hypothetical protein